MRPKRQWGGGQAGSRGRIPNADRGRGGRPRQLLSGAVKTAVAAEGTCCLPKALFSPDAKGKDRTSPGLRSAGWSNLYGIAPDLSSRKYVRRPGVFPSGTFPFLLPASALGTSPGRRRVRARFPFRGRSGPAGIGAGIPGRGKEMSVRPAGGGPDAGLHGSGKIFPGFIRFRGSRTALIFRWISRETGSTAPAT